MWEELVYEKYILMRGNEIIGILGENSDGSWNIKNEKLIPKSLDTRLRKSVFITNEAMSAYPGFQSWLAQRVVTIDRGYIKKVLNELKLTQAQDESSKAQISLFFRAVSLLDNYWLRTGDDDTTAWEDVNLRENPLSECIATLALTGQSMSLQIKEFEKTAEITTGGSYPKGWFREKDGLYLYKSRGAELDEVEREICASNVIDCFDVYGNLKYEEVRKFGVKCSKCRLMSNADISVVHAGDVKVWCNINEIDFKSWVIKNYEKEYAQMIVIDYLIANRDRHLWNWGFYQDSKTGEILGPHPLYDHNNAFDVEYLKNGDKDSIVEEGYTMKEAAKFWKRRSELKLIKKPTAKMFPNKLAYNEFNKRCGELEIKFDGVKGLNLF